MSLRPRLVIASALVGAMALVFVSSRASAAPVTYPLLDRLGVAQGSAKVSLATGSVSMKLKLPRLPAVVDTGTVQFTATIYKAYLTSSVDPAIEIPLATVYPTAKNAAVVKAGLKGDVSQLGLDQILVVAYSKDGLSSFNVLTGAAPVK
jgi:hypothetical protein